MQQIIRIEHPRDGNGLWFATNLKGNSLFRKFSFYQDLVAKHDNFPTPREDTLIFRRPEKDEYCAFKSILQVQQWLESSWFKELKDFGFEIYALQVSECIEGEFQILFKKEHIVEKQIITNLF